VLSSLSPNGRGMLAMMAASIIFTFSDVLAKLAAQDWPIAQILVVRGLFAISLSLLVAIRSGDGRKLALLGRPSLVARSGIEALTALAFLSALPMMPIADLTAILMASPLVITALASLLLGETVGWRRWSAIVVGFAGVLLVVQPSGTQAGFPLYHWGALLGVAAVFCVAFRDITTRRIGADVPSTVVTVGGSIGSCLGGVVLSVQTPWAGFALQPFIACVAAAGIVTLGNYLIITACRGVDLSVVAPYRYFAMLWAIGLGALIFGELPNMLSLVGMALIVATGIYTMHREQVRRRQAQKQQA